MADEPVVDLNVIDEKINKTNKVEERIKELSEKVRLTSSERDELAKSKLDLESTNASLTKERDFYASFSKSTSKYPQAGEYQDDIKSKVLAGYTVDDAVVSVLASKGKLTSPAPDRESVAGGSATNPPPKGSPKSLGEMTREEKRAALVEAEAKGDFAITY